MPNINLLPWREKRREAQKREFGAMLIGAIIFAVLVLLITHLVMSSKINTQEKVNNYLVLMIQQLDENIVQLNQVKQNREEMLEKLKVIRVLQENRPVTVHIFDELPKILPKGIYLTQFSREGEVLSLEGSAESNTSISELMRTIEASLWLENPVLVEIKTEPDKQQMINYFHLQMHEQESALIATYNKNTVGGKP